jgi:Fe-S-cluster containining protein
MENLDQNFSYNELERQTEKASLFTHTVLSQQIIRQNENDFFLYGLIDYLTAKGMVVPEDLKKYVETVKNEIIEKKEYASLGASIRKDNDGIETTNFVPVNCEERLPICKAVCCKLSFALSVEEIEEGKLKWELGKPYHIRHQSNGYCCHINNENKQCNVYENRPSVCKKYSCAQDHRIWKDFDKMILNQQWIDECLSEEKLKLMDVYMKP